jgi:serine/threonine protein kinase
VHNAKTFAKIKPSNVIVEPITTSTSERSQRAILMDFGIARFMTESTMLTASGDVLGTVDYISPEQVHGAADLSRGLTRASMCACLNMLPRRCSRRYRKSLRIDSSQWGSLLELQSRIDLS